MNIKEARLAAGLTQQKMSELFEIPKRTIENWETGSRKCPSYVEKLIIEKLEREKEMSKYITQDRESGSNIEKFNTIEEAKEAINNYEADDKEQGIYEEGFYSIYCTLEDKWINYP